MSDPRHDPSRVVRAPRGARLTCRSWLTEAPYRMLQNNLDPEVAERPEDLVVYGGIGRAARDWASYDAILTTLKTPATTKPCWSSRASRSACSRPIPTRRAYCSPIPTWCRTGPHLGALQRARPQGSDDVRADDRRLMDLHRLAGHRAGHLRDLRRDGSPALRRQPYRQVDTHCRSGRHGRRAAAGRLAGRRQFADHRMPAEPHRFPPAYPLRRRAGHRPRRRAGADREIHRQRRGEIDRAARQCRRGPARTGAPRRAPGLRHRPDQCARSGARLPAIGLDGGAVAGRAEERSGTGPRRGQGLDAHPCRGDAGLPRAGYPDRGLRQQHPADGLRRRSAERVRFPRLRAGVCAAAVLPRRRPVPLGRPERRPGGHLQDRRQGQGADSR